MDPAYHEDDSLGDGNVIVEAPANLEATGHQNYPHTSSVNVYKNQTGKASQLNPMYSPGDKS